MAGIERQGLQIVDSVTEELWQRLGGVYPDHDVPFWDAEPQAGGPKRCLALVLAYHGGGFSGWQLQPKQPTIQGAVEAALSQLCDQPVRVHASGRTDSGVHALGQVASFATTSTLSLVRMERGLKALLPYGVSLRALGPVPQSFHARFDAKAKTYDYYLWPKKTSLPFLAGRLWPLPYDLDLGAMQRALDPLPGPRDLRALASRGWEAGDDTVRRIVSAKIHHGQDGPWRLRITASGFLRHVVRNLVGVLSQVGQGSLAPEALMEMITAGRRIYSGPKAPPQGLYLSTVYYRREPSADDGGLEESK